ncbi:MAG TPA: fimbrial protein [Scandinavium sp.]|jgi:type 1 fimbria pilin|uniref:fimbrial protein n=1 Tax=Scandinavium sp. TaxID=2830653 RepID=UPI002E33EFDF|nr:fimbrial protein [Scandinavium sp.]HEX4503368.1 fimbrial protein [Scandinavium sp.]
MNGAFTSKFYFLFVFLFLLAGKTEATCSNVYHQTSTSDIGNIVVQRDAPIGTILKTFQTPGTDKYADGCAAGGIPPDTFGLQMSYSSTLSSSGNHIYDANLSGVGIRIWNSSSGPAGWTYDNPKYVADAPVGNTYWPGYSATVEIIKTGPIKSGLLPSGTMGRLYLLGFDGQYHEGVTLNTTGGSVTALACSITTANISFPIGNILASSFGTTVGTTPSNGQNTQNLGLNCDAGANVNVSLSGTQNPDVSTTSVLALTGQGDAGVATGVGVQLLYNGTPLVLNNRIVLKLSSGGQETFPLTARYYQTKTAVTTGSANTSATLNLTYQ